ncbi:Exodeoxyribonuclease V beta chain [Acinetobacter haemolyticus CIP 64.3 = MTCC 9819]|uniref:RecBCD enzyme subunit RecB n=1 Tax=Acinetobacter haemolyticus CIP 64.3 = MTCC 9819 TaxID=1217659 RepID=N9F123_ACIHA|nr:UvrD-helicase domain-containing protein [Acinetobacter haemolyticus]ENW16237.1 exodeoxyribonuclease V, beta subunit [Acinetobacter haemolyticus CIP 64.3 = MTCC 9819]EPR90561.1 Exodeoxyribonuclease V beta chain [Acinetobacter haemolyticus CIP 64.3 = MTCC 9819]QXZ27183.1 UvrD-helicase domain-containing protein [Acinetobacter haemolyticus]SPT48267.1 recB [Acinetobacter haemolyticus]SUU65348.1 recB [Acinetobacter haemolyticus]
MSSKFPVSYQPICDIQFEGLHLIEASAGTGKTYTLSSLMVRIFLEKYLPNQVIATTFTRAAAAELKSRIRARLIEVQQYLEPMRTVLESDIYIRAAQESDPLKQHLLKTFAPRIAYACERLKLVIDQLDELFVGTLDSFSQKLLREFAFESGKIERAQITEDAKAYTRQLIHDVLREWIQSQPQHVIDALYSVGALKSVDHFVGMVESSLNFSSAQFKLPDMPEIELAQLQQWQQQAQQIDLSTLAEYFNLDGAYYSHINGTSFRNNAFNKLFCESLPQLLKALADPQNIQVFDSYFSDARETVFKFLDKLDSQKIFKKCPAEVSDGFYQHPTILHIQKLCHSVKETQQQFEQLQVYLKAYLCIEVKKRLPQVLQQKGETTFAQQIKTLSEALKGEQGQRFAVFVQARYPLILVDEFQDTNQDQDDMLATIWRHPQRYQKGCMIMVGDRKQAIYGFRGGDMLTFLNAYQDIMSKQGREYKLIHNHRSVKELVEVVDVLFQRQMDFGEQVLYDPIQAGSRPHPALIENGQLNPAPLRWLQLQDGNEQATQVAWKIQSLLNQAHLQQLYLDGDNHQVISEDDIAVLSRSHRQLDEVQYALERLGIRVNRPSKRSVFDSKIAQDVGALLTALLHPYDEAKLKRALLSRLFGFDLSQLVALEQSAEGLSHYIQQFDDIREMWRNQGFLVAWQRCLNQFEIWQQLVATQSKDNERAVVNLRHLTDILSQHSEHVQGIHNLYHWYLKQLHSPSDREWELEHKLSSEAGVQLMTIHQSKGLEFKIVFLLGANKAFSEMQKTLNFSTTEIQIPETGQTRTQRVVAIADKNFLQQTELDQHQQRAQAEQNRLWYVALTRASHRVYAIFEPEKGDKNKLSGLAFWKNHGDIFQHPYSVEDHLLLERPASLRTQETQPERLLAAEPLPTQRFYARGKTSFSYLAQHLKHKANRLDRLANADQQFDQAEDEINLLTVESVAVSQPIAWIKQYFPKGTLAGNFLHEIFEQIDFQHPETWIEEIRRRFKNTYQGLWVALLEQYQQHFPEQENAEQQLYQWIALWLADVLQTPLNQGFQLQQLVAGQYLSECPFYLALSDRVLAMQRVQQLFEEYDIQMPEFIDAKSARYLNGSIDLVYFDGQRYHIADYKSNYLGENQADYQSTQIAESMSLSSYWLQAALYLVALHRYLSVKLQNYRIEQHLGGASYLYLRGMNGQADQGYFYWKLEDEFVLRLDAILGYFSEDKQGKGV